MFTINLEDGREAPSKASKGKNHLIIRGFYLSIRQKSSTRPLVATINIRGILQPMMRIPNVVLRSVVDNGTVLVKICVVHS